MEEADDQRSITIGTWNIHGGRDIHNRYNFDAIIATTRQLSPTIIGLQEVDSRFRPRSNFDNQPTILGEHLDHEVHFGGNIVDETPAQPRAYGNATLSTLPITNSDHTVYPDPGEGCEDAEPRGVLHTTVSIDGLDLTIFNTHLSLANEYRQQQIEYLLELTKDYRQPIVVLGDFNATPDERSIQRLTTEFTPVQARAPHGSPMTYPAHDPSQQIDYVFVSDDIEVKDALVHATTASDHRPIRATITLPTNR